MPPDSKAETKNAYGHGVSPILTGTIVVDLDGPIVDIYHCPQKCDYTDYPKNHASLKRTECPVVDGAVEMLKKYKARGFRIVIWTARVEVERWITEEWLRAHGVPFDELVMTKPLALIYIDDLASEFRNWHDTEKVIEKRIKAIGKK